MEGFQEQWHFMTASLALPLVGFTVVIYQTIGGRFPRGNVDFGLIISNKNFSYFIFAIPDNGFLNKPLHIYFI
jgi:hypothetical protein